MWETQLGAPIASLPVHDGTRLFAVLRSGSLVAVNVETGAPVWVTRAAARGPLTVSGARVVTATEGGVEAFNAESGSASWRYPIGESLVTAIAADADLVFVLLDSGVLKVLRGDTGDLAWEAEVPEPARAVPHLAAGRVFVATRQGRVLALSRDGGAPIWTTLVTGEPTGFAATDTRLFLGTRGKLFYSLHMETGALDWRWRIGAESAWAPAVDSEHVYFCSFDNLVRALDRGHGAQRWRKPLPARPLGTPLLFGPSLVAPYLAAEIRGMGTNDGANQGRYPTERELAAPPVLVVRPLARGGELLVLVQSNGLATALQRRVEPPIVPMTAVPGSLVPVIAAPPPPGATPPAPRSPSPAASRPRQSSRR